MNSEHIKNYNQAQTTIKSLNEGLAEKRKTVMDLNRQIGQTQREIGDIRERLRKEDLALENPSRLRQPTLTHAEYEAHRQAADEREATLPTLKNQIEPMNREIARLEIELSDQHRVLNDSLKRIAADTVAQSETLLIEKAGELLKNFVMATIAAEGKAQGFTLAEQQRFKQETANAVFDRLLPKLFGNNAVPDSSDAMSYVMGLVAAPVDL